MVKEKKGKYTLKEKKYIECYMSGMNKSESYLEAYDVKADTKPQSIHVNASKIHARLAPRFNELYDKLDEQNILRLGEHANALEAIRDEAKKAKQFSAATNAEVSRGKLMGFYVDKSELTGKNGKDLIPDFVINFKGKDD